MAIDMISEPPSLATSPRISSSHEFCHENDDATNIEFDSNSEFDFCISNNTNTETCLADELFSDGLIRPLQLQEKYFVTYSKQIPLSTKTQGLVNSHPPLIPASSSKQEMAKPNALAANISETEHQKNQSCNSFWSMKRSRSIHCVNTHKKSSFWSLPLLSRSKSTGSVPNAKQSGQKQSAQVRQMKNNSAAPPSFYTFPSSQKPPLRKSYGLSGLNYGAGIWINPVLNVTPPKGTANLFGLGSLFRNGKEKKSKK